MDTAIEVLFGDMKNDSEELLPELSADDWINQLQVLDLPQFFTDIPEVTNNTNYSSDQRTVEHPITSDNFSNSPPSLLVENDKITKRNEPSLSEINQVLQQFVTKDSQHNISGPMKPMRIRPVSSPVEAPAIKSGVTLTRDQLLSFTSDDIDEFEREITSKRSLTPAERKEMKRQRRLIKNRESAQQSRQRKKGRVDELEHVVEELNGVNKSLNEKLNNLEAESTILRAEVAQLVGVIRESPMLSGLLRNVASILIFYALQASKAQEQKSFSPVRLPTHTSIEAC